MREIIIFILLFAGISLALDIEFLGTPKIRINESGNSRAAHTISTEKEAREYECLITTDGEQYYWASRENTEVVKVFSGAFINYVALNGSGYVRVVMPEVKEGLFEKGSYDYVEHLLSWLTSVTYYGYAK